MAANEDLPDIGAIVGPRLAEAPKEHQPYVVAWAERLAAGRYRIWAESVTDARHRARLLACAAREEEIASRIEALSADAGSIQRDFLAAHPDLPGLYASLFEGRTLAEQMQIQAAGERLGAATWRALARGADGRVAEVLASCAPLEEESAETLEEIVAAGV